MKKTQITNTPSCAFCDSLRMREVMDFGEVALAGGFIKPEHFDQELKFSLRLHFCLDCYAVQVIDKVPENVLFQHYFYFSSYIATLREHFQNYACEIKSRFLDNEKTTVLEFGCNDGVLLKPLADQGIRTVIGVDPAGNVISTINDPRVTVVNDFFTEKVADYIVAEHGRADIIMANNVYAHIPDIQGTTRAIKQTLKDDGVFVFEVHYLGKVITEMQYDMIYHEHLYYYSLLSAIKHFERYDMMVFDVKEVPIHGGSMRFYVCKKGSKYSSCVSEAVILLEAVERTKCFDQYKTFQNFSYTVDSHRVELIKLLNKLRKQGHTIAGYGASGRANSMIQYCGINHDHLEYIIDDSPVKVGFYTPGSHFEICMNSILNKSELPDYLLIFAWSFFNEIRKNNSDYLTNGGQMILPLPEISIFPQPQQ
jgi:methylation protein EvaC